MITSSMSGWKGAAVVAALFAGRAIVAAAADEPEALKAVQGNWAVRDDAEVAGRWTIEKDTFKAVINGIEYEGKVKVDDKAKPHPAIDFKVEKGPGDVEGKTSKGVYKLEGEKFILNVAHPGGERPKDFEPVADQSFVFEMTKVKTK